MAIFPFMLRQPLSLSYGGIASPHLPIHKLMFTLQKFKLVTYWGGFAQDKTYNLMCDKWCCCEKKESD